MLAARASGAEAGLIAATSTASPADVAAVGDCLLDVLADLDGSGRPLFSALRALAVPGSAHGRAWRAAELVREHRGDGHIAAGAASGLDPVQLNVLTEVWLGFPTGEYSATRGYGPDRVGAAVEQLHARGWLDEAGALTASGRAARDGIEAVTDRSQDGLITALGDRVEDVIAAATRVSAAVLDHHAAPADPRKRAAG
jgi:hypothetical protein